MELIVPGFSLHVAVVALATAALVGCGTAPRQACLASAVPPRMARSAAVPPAAVVQAVVVQREPKRPDSESPGIKAFDCTSLAPDKQGEWLRDWRLGGPNGAAWNWDGSDLSCKVLALSDCDGQLHVALDVGRQHAAESTVVLVNGRLVAQALRVAAAQWSRATEKQGELPYETLLLVIRVDVTCEQSDQSVAAQHWSDSFVAGFAGGE